MLCEGKLSVPRESAAARALDVDKVEELLICVGEASPLWVPDCPPLGPCRLNCKAFARAFSCVRTNCARFCQGISSQPFQIASSYMVGLTLTKTCPSSDSMSSYT